MSPAINTFETCEISTPKAVAERKQKRIKQIQEKSQNIVFEFEILQLSAYFHRHNEPINIH